MIILDNLELNYGEKILFKDVSLQFVPGNCYGIIGANGSGKSTFLKILSNEIDYYRGQVSIPKDLRLSILKQNHEAYDKYSVLETIIMGNKKLYEVHTKRDELYSKEEMTDEEGMLVGELEGEYGELGGYEIESDIALLLLGLGLNDKIIELDMNKLNAKDKVKVLLAQAIYGNPDILLLDEPTNGLDINAIIWLEEFLINFQNTVIVVSHDRHFLNQVCTHICDIDFNKIRMYSGNYDFWYEASQLISKQLKDQKKKNVEKADELKTFISRFASNASKSKQASSRKKILEKLDLENLPSSIRKFPYISFSIDKDLGKNILDIKNLSCKDEDEVLFTNLNLEVNKEDRIAFIGALDQIKTAFFEVITGNKEYSGSYTWGQTVKFEYLPRENNHIFNKENNLTIQEYINQYNRKENDDTQTRSFLGRMLFSGDEIFKKTYNLSGGEKVRVLLSKIMINQPNVIILNEPTNHLDLEAITSLNKGLMDYKGILLFSSHDHEFIQSISNRIIELTPNGIIDRRIDFDSYIRDEKIAKLRKELYGSDMKL